MSSILEAKDDLPKFRAEIRAWLADAVPADWRPLTDAFRASPVGQALTQDRQSVQPSTLTSTVPNGAPCGSGTMSTDAIATACNSRKANRLPHEAHMRLVRKPVRPKWRPVISLVLGNQNCEVWKDFLDVAYWNVELEE